MESGLLKPGNSGGTGTAGKPAPDVVVVTVHLIYNIMKHDPTIANETARFLLNKTANDSLLLESAFEPTAAYPLDTG